MPPTRDAMTGWSCLRDAELIARSHQMIRLIVDRTTTGDQVAELAFRAAEQATQPNGWYPPSLSHGNAGTALLHLYAARAGLGDADVAFDHIREAVLATQVEPLESPGMFGGTSGLALALADCTRDEPRFRPSLDRLHDRLADQVLSAEPPMVERGLSDADYDLITGAAGTLAYLSSVEEPSEPVRAAIGRLLEYLVWLSEPGTEVTPRRWLLVPDVYPPLPHYRESYPHGYLNLGLAHGVPGVAAALAVAWQAGHRHPRHLAAIDTLTSWIRDHRGGDEFGPLWPAGVPVGEDGTEREAPARRDQLAWCYGTAGVSAALLTVAEATGNGELRQVAVEAFEAVLRRTREATLLSPTLCHGHAGILLMCREFAASSAAAREALPVLLEELLAYGDPDLPIVFADQEVPGSFVDDPSLLTGATGVALTLLAVTGEERPQWFRAFLGR